MLIGGAWRPSRDGGTFTATNPRTGQKLADVYPISGWEDIETALTSAAGAAPEMRDLADSGGGIGAFLDAHAAALEARADALCQAAH